MKNSTAPVIQIDVWSDYVCPFCYLQLPVLQRIAEAFEPRVHVTWRAFELRPEPHALLDPKGEYLRTTWDRSVYPMARERGMTLRLPPVQPRSRQAFEAAAQAAANGRFDAMHEALFKAFFEDGADIGDPAILERLGEAVGLPPGDLRQALSDGRHRALVAQDQELAYRLGVTGVPAAVVRVGGCDWEDAAMVQGAVPYARLEAAVSHMLERASG